MCVFNLRLKTDKAFKLRRSVGKLFHNLGAVTLKARSPTDLRAMGWYSLMALSERRRLSTLRGCRRSHRYDGASLCRHLNTITITLNWIRHQGCVHEKLARSHWPYVFWWCADMKIASSVLTSFSFSHLIAIHSLISIRRIARSLSPGTLASNITAGCH